jgi:glycosyltransferase involved in cell wall biosynthesis
VLHVGDLHTRRNLGVALDAVIALRVAEPACAGMSLALVGVDRGEADRLRRRAEDAGHPQALHFVGSVDEDELLRWYRGASALVYPSVYEGFGLPLLEAMACGIAVVASDIPASAELAGDAAVLVPPTDARAWTDALRSVLVDPVRRTRLSDRGRSRAAVFTWERAARATWQAYRDAAAS